MSNRLSILYDRIITLQSAAQNPSTRTSFDPKRTFLWLALFSEAIQQLTEISMENEEEVVQADAIFELFIIWHTDSTLNESTSPSEPELSGGRVKVAMAMNASDNLSLSVAYWNLVQVKLSFHDSQTSSLEHVDAVLKCGIAILCDRGAPHGINATGLYEWIFLNNWIQNRAASEKMLLPLLSTMRKNQAAYRTIVAISQAVKAYALLIGESNASLGVQFQIISLTLLKSVVTKPNGKLEEIQQLCAKEDVIKISISELYKLIIINASLLKNHLLSIQHSFDYIKILETRFTDTVTVADIEEMYEAYDTLGRSQYTLKQFTQSLATYQLALSTLTTPTHKTNPRLSKKAYFHVANVLESLHRYREALAYIRASAHLINPINVDENDVHILFLLGCLEYRCALEIDSTDAPPHSAVLELLKQAHEALKRALLLASGSEKVNVAIQMCVLLVDLQRFKEAEECMKENRLSKNVLSLCEKGKSGKGVIWSEPVWSVLLRLAKDDEEMGLGSEDVV